MATHTRSRISAGGWPTWLLVRLKLLAFVGASLLAQGIMPGRGADGTL